MTNIEMDDVLSSIRRLVSVGGDDVSDIPAAADDRFILTPALRVPDDTVLDDTVPDDMVPEPASTPKTEPPADLATMLNAVAKSARVAAGRETDPPSPEFAAMESAWKDELARVAAARQASGDDDDADPTGARAPQSLENQIAELEEAVGQSAEDWEPDGSEPEAEQPPHRHIFEVVSNTGPLHGDDDRRDADAVPVFSHVPVTRPKPYLLSNNVPDAESSDEISDLAIEPATPPLDDPVADIVEDDDVFLDVEALRSMITEVVRKELRGKLGETITRNVRKMIQQEITQAITSQEPDDDA